MRVGLYLENLRGGEKFGELHADIKKIKFIFKKCIFETYSTDPLYISMVAPCRECKGH